MVQGGNDAGKGAFEEVGLVEDGLGRVADFFDDPAKEIARGIAALGQLELDLKLTACLLRVLLCGDIA